MSPERLYPPVQCLRCGFENELGDRYCKQCGASLTGPTPVTKPKADPALISIIVTVAGTLFIPLAGGVVGLILAYRALRGARTSGGQRGSEKLAKTAVIVGWGGVALGVLPLCMLMTMSGAQLGISACEGLFQALSDMLPAGLGR